MENTQHTCPKALCGCTSTKPLSQLQHPQLVPALFTGRFLHLLLQSETDKDKGIAEEGRESGSNSAEGWSLQLAGCTLSKGLHPSAPWQEH